MTTVIFLFILWLYQKFLEIVYLPVHIMRIFQKSRKCPPITNKILLLSASDLAKKIRQQEITSLEVTQVYISRINEVNPIINAIIDNRFEKALEEAKIVDDLISNSGLTEQQIKDKYPLLGVPITVQGSIAVEGMIHTSGSPDRTCKADLDATIVKYVKKAGAIPLLTSNVPEICSNWETSNKLVGTTSNPYDSTRTPGGSSGGEASLLACGASAMGIGSDLAGSLRVPAHYCGVWGHKPSPYVVPYDGHYPECINKGAWKDMFTMGPITRYASDLRLLLQIIAEPEVKDVLNLYQKIDLRKIKVYYMEDTNSVLSDRLSVDVLSAMKKVIAHFNIVCDLKCTKVELPLMKYCAEMSYLRVLLLDMDVDELFQGKTDKIFYEMLRFLVGMSKHELTALGVGLFRRCLGLIPEKVINDVNNVLKKLRKFFLELLGDETVIIVPTCPGEATYHNDMFRKSFNYGYCSIFNVLGFPATSCPVLFSKRGLPVGVQVVAAPNLDRLNLYVAEELEKAFGGWKFS